MMNAAAGPAEEAEASELMREYLATRDVEIRNELVMHYSYIAKTVAIRLRGVFQNYAQTEDIVNQGIIALIDCIEKYDPDRGTKFESYAFMRVRGAVIDFVRKQDWLPRRLRVTAKTISATHEKLCNELMREPTVQEIADDLGMPVSALEKHYSEISNSVMLSFEGLIQNVNQMGELLENSMDEESMPESKVFRDELRETLRDAIDGLSERERMVISLYYYEHLKLSDISGILGVSDQRVSQIISKAVLKLRYKLEKYMKG